MGEMIKIKDDELKLIRRALSDSMNYNKDDRFAEKLGLLIKLTHIQIEREDK